MDQLTLYRDLVWDTMGQDPDVSSVGDDVMVDGTTRGIVRQGRVVLNFDADRVAELVAQNLGAVYEAHAGHWLAVDAGVDEATLRELFSEATADRNVPRAAISRFVRGIVAEINRLPELSNPDWDTYSLAAEVSNGLVKAKAFRYTESGPPVPTGVAGNDDMFRDLHAKRLGDDGKPWEVVLVKMGRGAPTVEICFRSGEDAEMWRVNPENTARLAEALRWLPGELPEPDEQSTATAAEIWQEIADDILALPELSNPDWDTFSMVVEMTDNMCAVTAYRYTESGPPQSTEEPESDDLFWQLREMTRGTNGEAWDVALVKFKRDTASLVMTFLSGESAERWRVKPQNIDHLPESLRPRPEDFEASADGEGLVTPVDFEPGPARSEIPLLPGPEHSNGDGHRVPGDQSDLTRMPRLERRQRVIGIVALGVAAVLAVVVVVGVVRALGSGDWVVPSSAAVLMAAAVSQWAAVRARGRGGYLLAGEFALLVALGVLSLALCGLDFVTGESGDRAFTILFIAGLIVVVGGVLGSYRRSSGPGAAAGGTST